MKYLSRSAVLAASIAAAFGLSAATAASAASDRMYGKGAAFKVEDLPPGLLRNDLESLPGSQRGMAMRALHQFRFPASDAHVIRVDKEGGVYVADMYLPESVNPESAAGEAVTESISASDAFALHSRPGASKVIFLDFDGHVIAGTAWNSTYSTLSAKAFDRDGNPGVFSASELDNIAEIWHRIAEDFAAFDVDVTTEEPAIFGPDVGRILMTDNYDANGNPMPSSGAGGVAYVNVFGRADYSYYSPALVYNNNLSNHPPFIAEAASHEMGHNLGLSHDGVSGGTAYYGGHGSGWVAWGPIMGTGYHDNVSQWSIGEYPNANNDQDDIDIINGKVGLSADDHGDTLATASNLLVAEDGTVTGSHPQIDAFNTATVNKGVIQVGGDTDVFAFTAGAGAVDLTVTPSWLSWPRNGRGTNLDVEATLVDADGNVIASSDPLDNTDAQITANVASGNYYLHIRGVGNAISPYSAYGSQGHYFINGSVPVSGEPTDTTPPNPNPMSWAQLPAANDSSSISMTASIATDESPGAVQYYFRCTAGAAGCVDSGWQATTSYTATGLQDDSSYSWTVKARDVAGNETGESAVGSATTDAAQPPPPAQPPAAPSNLIAADNADGSAALSWADNSDNETSFEVVRENWHQKRRRWRSTTTIATTDANVASVVDSSGTGLYRYRVRASNAAGASAYSNWAEVTVTSAGGGGGGNGGCKGGPKKCP